MVYRLALAYGAPPGSNRRIREVFRWWAGLFVAPRPRVAWLGYSQSGGSFPGGDRLLGTYTTGIVAWRWYESVSWSRPIR